MRWTLRRVGVGSHMSDACAVCCVGSSIHLHWMAAPASASMSSGSDPAAALPRALPISEAIELACPVCMEEYNQGRVLSQRPLVAACGHTICGRCVQGLAAGANHFSCPLCRAQSPVHLPVNFALIALLSAVASPSVSVAAGASLTFVVTHAGKPAAQFTLPADSSLEHVIATVRKHAQLAPSQTVRMLDAAGKRLQAGVPATFPLLVGEKSDVSVWPPVIGSASSFASFFHALRSHFATPKQRLAATQVTVKDSTLRFGGQSNSLTKHTASEGTREAHWLVADASVCVCIVCALCVCVGTGFSLSLQRTLRLPCDGKVYPLPPGLGTFDIVPVAAYAASVPPEWNKHGGVIVPIQDAEAMWMAFDAGKQPVAVQVAAGKINALTGEPFQTSLQKKPQNYCVADPQPWLDGFNSGNGTVQQFVATQLGSHVTAEAQIKRQMRLDESESVMRDGDARPAPTYLASDESVGGIQLQVRPALSLNMSVRAEQAGVAGGLTAPLNRAELLKTPAQLQLAVGQKMQLQSDHLPLRKLTLADWIGPERRLTLDTSWMPICVKTLTGQTARTPHALPERVSCARLLSVVCVCVAADVVCVSCCKVPP